MWRMSIKLSQTDRALDDEQSVQNGQISKAFIYCLVNLHVHALTPSDPNLKDTTSKDVGD